MDPGPPPVAFSAGDGPTLPPAFRHRGSLIMSHIALVVEYDVKPEHREAFE